MTKKITEKQFEAQVKDLAKIFGWLYYHTWRSIHSPAGFPDCVMVRPPRLIFAELKSEKGIVSKDQQKWLDILRRCSFMVSDHLDGAFYQNMPEVYLWCPSDIERIAETLK